MGLSDFERNDKVIWAIQKIHELASAMADNYQTNKLREVALSLWPALLSNSSNSARWIMGSSTSGSTIGETGLFEAAMRSVKDSFVKEDSDDFQKKMDEFEHERELFIPDACRLMSRQDDGALAQAFEIYRWTEQYFYASNRYDDAFAAGLKQVSDKMAMIQGLFFPIMARNSTISKAWMMENILSRYVEHGKDDLFYVVYKSLCLHHDMGLDIISNEDVYKEFKELQTLKFEDVTYEKRILFILKVAGRRFHYAHQHKAFLDYVEKNNGAMKVNISKVKAALKKCSEAYDKYKKDSRKRYKKYCHFTGQES